ncbi:hypothetical protein BC833DRAFT_585489 [Globomyces pollinis-pini]|nr:hypothetical protein BC833DRAFT_585489 [Globomyces pollinis-pini]
MKDCRDIVNVVHPINTVDDFQLGRPSMIKSNYLLSLKDKLSEKNCRKLNVENMAFNLDKLIDKALQHHKAKSVPDFAPLLFTPTYEDFLRNAIAYCRSYIREKMAVIYHKVAKAEGGTVEVPTSLFKHMETLNQTKHQATDKLELLEVRQEVHDTFTLFSQSYCFLLLSNSKISKTQSRERSQFECIYAITSEIVTRTLEHYELSYLIIYELQRVFRSDVFKPVYQTLFRDPLHQVNLKYLISIVNPVMTRQVREKSKWEMLLPLLNSGKLGNGETRPVTATKMVVEKVKPRERIRIHSIRMLRSPLADEVLPPVQRFLFTQNRASAISGVVG